MGAVFLGSITFPLLKINQYRSDSEISEKKVSLALPKDCLEHLEISLLMWQTLNGTCQNRMPLIYFKWFDMYYGESRKRCLWREIYESASRCYKATGTII